LGTRPTPPSGKKVSNYVIWGKLECDTLRGEYSLRVAVMRVLKRRFITTSDTVTGGWRKCSNEELNNV
jgi:hypothetical protein